MTHNFLLDWLVLMTQSFTYRMINNNKITSINILIFLLNHQKLKLLNFYFSGFYVRIVILRNIRNSIRVIISTWSGLSRVLLFNLRLIEFKSPSIKCIYFGQILSGPWNFINLKEVLLRLTHCKFKSLSHFQIIITWTRGVFYFLLFLIFSKLRPFSV